MKESINITLGVLATLGIFLLWVLVFTIPFWLVWGCIISPKFELPTFTFAESFFVALTIKWLFTSNNTFGKSNEKG